jgi:hypothetical protein
MFHEVFVELWVWGSDSRQMQGQVSQLLPRWLLCFFWDPDAQVTFREMLVLTVLGWVLCRTWAAVGRWV